MSHTAGLTIHGFPGYDVDAPVPTLVQIFNGEKPANTSRYLGRYAPGTVEQDVLPPDGRPIEQQMMIDVTGKAFSPEFMREIWASTNRNERAAVTSNRCPRTARR